MTHEIRALRTAATVFAVGYVLSQFLPTLPEGTYSDAQVLALLEGDDRAMIVVGGYCLAIAGVAALVFTAVLTKLIDRAEPSAYTDVARTAGTGYAAMLLLAAVLFTSIPMGHGLGELPSSDGAGPFREFTNAGFFTLLVPGLLCAAIMVTATSLAGRRTRLMPRWCTNLGLVTAPLMLLGAIWLPQFLVPVWALGLAFGIRPQSTTPVHVAAHDRPVAVD